MAVWAPEPVREAWGDEAVIAFIPWLDEILADKTVPRDEYRQVLSRLDMLEHGVTLIGEGQAQMRTDFQEAQAQMRAEFQKAQAQMRAEFQKAQAQMRAEFKEDQAQMRAEVREELVQMRTDLGELYMRLDKIHERFDRMESRMGERFDTMYDRMLVQSRWLVGSIALFGTVITIVLTIAQLIK